MQVDLLGTKKKLKNKCIPAGGVEKLSVKFFKIKINNTNN